MPAMLNKGNLGYKVVYRTISWQDLVIREWGTEGGIRDVCYEFSNGRTALDSDNSTSGIYSA